MKTKASNKTPFSEVIGALAEAMEGGAHSLLISASMKGRKLTLELRVHAVDDVPINVLDGDNGA